MFKCSFHSTSKKQGEIPLKKTVFLSLIFLFSISVLSAYVDNIDLIAVASKARWINSDGVPIPFGTDGQRNGSVKYISDARMEDGQIYQQVLFTHPQWKAQGTLAGFFENISIPQQGGKLIIAGGLLEGNSRSDGVLFSADFRPSRQRGAVIGRRVVGNESGGRLGSFTARYDQKIDRLELDLAAYAGQTGTIMLTINAGRNSDYDSAAWTEAKLIFVEEPRPEDQIQPPKTLSGHQNRINSVEFSPDGKYLATAGGDGYAKVWEVETGNLILNLGRHAAHVFQATFSPDSRYLATAGADYARIWDIPGGTELRPVGDHSGRVNAVSFNARGNLLLTASADGTVQVWDWRSQNEILTIEISENDIYHACFSPDGRFIAAGGQVGLVGLWETNSGQPVRYFKGHTRAITSLHFNRSGNRLITTSGDNTSMVWDVATGNNILTLRGHSFNSAVFSPEDKYILSGNEAGKVILWNASDGQEVNTFNHAGSDVYSVAFSVDGKHFASGGENTVAKIWMFYLK